MPEVALVARNALAAHGRRMSSVVNSLTFDCNVATYNEIG